MSWADALPGESAKRAMTTAAKTADLFMNMISLLHCVQNICIYFAEQEKTVVMYPPLHLLENINERQIMVMRLTLRIAAYGLMSQDNIHIRSHGGFPCLPETVAGLKDPCKGKCRDPHRAGVLENNGAFIQCSAGCEHVIHEKDMPRINLRRPKQRKRPCHILYSLRTGKFNLRPRWSHPDEVITGERRSMPLAHPVGQEKRLIKTPLSEPFGMKRHGHDDIDAGKDPDPVNHPPAKRFPQRAARPVFELVNCLTQRPLELSDR
jgi:hypothetical protein